MKLIDFVNECSIDIEIEKVTVDAFGLYERFLMLIKDEPLYSLILLTEVENIIKNLDRPIL